MYSLPNFNLSVNIWRSASNPITDPPDVTAMGNLAASRRFRIFTVGLPALTAKYGQTAYLLLPKGTDVRSDSVTGGGDDTVEVPAGSGRYYIVVCVDDSGKGFANENRQATLMAKGPWPVPIP